MSDQPTDRKKPAMNADAPRATDAQIHAVMKVCREFYSTPVGVGPQFARAVIEAARDAR